MPQAELDKERDGDREIERERERERESGMPQVHGGVARKKRFCLIAHLVKPRGLTEPLFASKSFGKPINPLEKTANPREKLL